MKAAVIKEHGDLNVLNVLNVDEPSCPPDMVKVNIKASSINHLDIWVRKGIPGINIPLPMILGSDGAGVITETGSEVELFKSGDRVVIQPGVYDPECRHSKAGNENFSATYGILGETQPGVQCNYVVLKPENIYPMSKNLSFPEAASMQLVFMTAYQMIVKRALLKASETILIYGATSGVGAAAIQIAKDIGAKVITTVGKETKFDYAFQLGADHVFNHSDCNYFSGINNIVKKDKVDVVFEHPGLKTWAVSMKLLARGGRIVTCGSTTGHDVKIDLRHLFSKQQSILGSTMSNLDSFIDVQSKIEMNAYRPFVDKIYPLEDIREAHKRVEEREHLGKVVVSLQD